MRHETPRKPTVIKEPTGITLSNGTTGKNEFVKGHQENIPPVSKRGGIPSYVLYSLFGLLGLIVIIVLLLLSDRSENKEDQTNSPSASNSDAALFMEQQEEILDCMRKAVINISEDDLPHVVDWAKDRLSGLENQFHGFNNSLINGDKQAMMANDIIAVYCQFQRKGVPVNGCISDLSLSDCN